MFTLAYFFDPNYTFANNAIESRRTIKSQKISDLLRNAAFDLFIDRAKKEDMYVAKWLAQSYLLGWGVEPNVEKSKEWEMKTPTDPYPFN